MWAGKVSVQFDLQAKYAMELLDERDRQGGEIGGKGEGGNPAISEKDAARTEEEKEDRETTRRKREERSCVKKRGRGRG